ncbi:MAG TPA: alpha-amylase, partial [Acidobacteriota bacterium]
YGFAPGRDSANVAEQIDNPSSLLSLYRKLIRLRTSSQALAHGSIEVLTSPSMSSPVLAYLRKSNDQLVFVAHNLGGSFASAGPFRINATTAKALFTSGTMPNPSGTSGQWNLSMPPYSSGVWEMK